jgi:choline dehydrogenase-like flavoprotein
VTGELIRGERPALTFWEQALRASAVLLGLVSVGFAVWYVAKGLFSHAEYPFVANSLAKDSLLAALCWLVFWDVRRWASVAVPMLVLAHLLLIAGMVITALWGKSKGIDHTWIGPPRSGSALRTTWIAGDVLVVVSFLWMYRKAVQARYDLEYLPPSAFRALMALAEVLVLRDDRRIAPAEVAGRVDHYLKSFSAHEKWKIRLALIVLAFWPLATLRPPFHVMSLDLRERWVRRRFEDVSDRRLPSALRGVIRTAQQFCFMGYYADERAAADAGYVPFSKREGSGEAIANALERKRTRVECMDATEIAGEELVADVVIAGTGAGGAILAYELARRGRSVLMLERGQHVDPSEFTENEADQLSKLYADGALTLSRDFNFQVAQGMCVGGSTVVNNAVCFDIPGAVLERWIEPKGLNAGLDPDRVADAFKYVRSFLQVQTAGPYEHLNGGARYMVDALRDCVPWQFELVDCNIDGCLGSGYCNIGCPWGRKLSALDWTLPHAQRDFPGAVRILPGCKVDKVLMRDSRASGVQAQLDDGRRLTVNADTVVLSAGAIASSVILQRSGLGDGRAGRGLAFNMGSPVTLDFPEQVHSERGMQISHYLEPAGDLHGALALESWFNPIVAQSLFMPGWFEEHRANMLRYAYMTCLAVVVGTQSTGTVTAARFGGGVKLDFVPSNDDFVRVKEGIHLAAQIGLRAGARRVLPTTFRMMELHSEADLTRIYDEIADDNDVSVNSAHPQGGNPMSKDAMQGVVDPSFRVYGTLNVHVVDASVFPSSITVNPQLTVMALAAYAADEIAGPAPALPRQLAGSISHG